MVPIKRESQLAEPLPGDNAPTAAAKGPRVRPLFAPKSGPSITVLSTTHEKRMLRAQICAQYEPGQNEETVPTREAFRRAGSRGERRFGLRRGGK